MQRPRRIFRPAPSPRRWRTPFLVAGVVVLGGLLSGIGLPPALMGSAPREQDWSALAAEVRVVDGETLRLGDRTVRLAGLDAPERGEICADETGRRFDCGAGAAEALSRLVNGRSVVCLVAGRDRFGRGLGLCSAGGAELNEGLVTAGWALAGADDADLLAKEAAARRAARGLWAGGFTRPETWRRRD
ncbi:thermonuclease family protein [Roseomonas sp. AR75]|uniref:thermonuclease family protein n=1 Tax=Roseomonas sp. AR75 TaxID=2562311 RepID=UPI0010C05F74|nr:thermonuclease family protein [Roseomonas sp. AR75]